MPAEGLQDPRYCLSERLFRVRRQFLPLPLALLLKVQAAESDARKAPPLPPGTRSNSRRGDRAGAALDLQGQAVLAGEVRLYACHLPRAMTDRERVAFALSSATEPRARSEVSNKNRESTRVTSHGRLDADPPRVWRTGKDCISIESTCDNKHQNAVQALSTDVYVQPQRNPSSKRSSREPLGGTDSITGALPPGGDDGRPLQHKCSNQQES
jgi:hypothetical protein